MLVLTRQEGERILIDGRIWLSVIRSGRTVALGFECPDDVHVVREERIVPGEAGLRKHMDRLAARKAG